MKPPSTTRSVPVMKLASGPARKATALAISSEVPPLPIGEPWIMPLMVEPDGDSSSFRTIAVKITPGLILLILAPWALQARAAA